MPSNILERQSDNSLKIKLTLPWAQVQKAYAQELAEAVKTVEIKGFRRGKAPQKAVQEALGKETLYQRIIEKLIGQAYRQAIEENHLKPIATPKIKVISLEEGKDWQFEAESCEAPQVNLANYQKEIASLSAKNKIWTPGKDAQPQEKDQKNTNEQLSQIFEVLLKETKIQIPGILLEEEVNRQLATLLDEIKKLGLTLESYLASKNLSPANLRQQYQQQAAENLKLEFILSAVADDLKIQVSPADIDKMIANIKDPKEKTLAASQKYYLASILRRRQTVDALLKM